MPRLFCNYLSLWLTRVFAGCVFFATSGAVAAAQPSPTPEPTQVSPSPQPSPASVEEARQQTDAERERARAEAEAARSKAREQVDAERERARVEAETARRHSRAAGAEARSRAQAEARALRDRSRQAADAAQKAALAALDKNRSDVDAAVNAAVAAAREAGIAISERNLREALSDDEVTSAEFSAEVRDAVEEATEAALDALDEGDYSYSYSYSYSTQDEPKAAKARKAPKAPKAPVAPAVPVAPKTPRAHPPSSPQAPKVPVCRDCDDDAEQASEDLYESAMDSIDEEDWGDAIETLDELLKSPRAEHRHAGALYWKAYAQSKVGRATAALATLTQLQKSFPQNSWSREAKALEGELRSKSGQAPNIAETEDTDLKLMALQALSESDPTEALPVLQKLISSPTESRRVRERALFVLANAGATGVRSLAEVARGSAGPDMQRKAIEYLGVFGGAEARRVLAEIYASLSPASAGTTPARLAELAPLKRQILNSFMVAGDKARVLNAARTEQDAKLRGEATRLLGVMGAMTELREIYKSARSADEKKVVLQALFVGGASDDMAIVARTEGDPSVREAAVHHLGLMGRKTQETLMEMYRAETVTAVKKQVLQAFFLQGNATKLIEVARAEKDPVLKKEAVRLLALTNSKEARPFLLELLKQEN